MNDELVTKLEAFLEQIDAGMSYDAAKAWGYELVQLTTTGLVTLDAAQMTLTFSEDLNAGMDQDVARTRVVAMIELFKQPALNN